MSYDKCDVTGSTDRVHKLPEYMQTDKVKYVCFKVAVKMEKERLEALKGKVSDVAIEAAKEVVDEIAEKPKNKLRPKTKKKK